MVTIERAARRAEERGGANERPAALRRGARPAAGGRGPARAARSSSPVAGQKSVDLDFHPELAPRFSGIETPYPEIPTAPTGMELLNEKIEATLKKVSDVPIDEVLLQLKATLASAQKLLDSGDLHGAVQDLRLDPRDGQPDARRRREDAGQRRRAWSTDARSTMTSVNDTVKRLGTTLEQLNRTLATVDRNVERTGDVQLEAAQTLDEMHEVLKSLRFLVEHPAAAPRGAAARQARAGGEEVMRTRALAGSRPGPRRGSFSSAAACSSGRSTAQTYVLDPLAAPGAAAPRETPVRRRRRPEGDGPRLDRPAAGHGTGRQRADRDRRVRALGRADRRGHPARPGREPGRAPPRPPRGRGSVRAQPGRPPAGGRHDHRGRAPGGRHRSSSRRAGRCSGRGATTLVQRRSSHRARPTTAGAAGPWPAASEALAALSREIADALSGLPVAPPRPAAADPAR